MKSELFKRVAAGVVLIPVVIYILFTKQAYPFNVGVYILIFIGNYELYKMGKAAEKDVSLTTIMFSSLIIPQLFYFQVFSLSVYFIVIITTVLFIFKLFSEEPTKNVISYISTNLFLSIFFPFFFSFIWLIKRLNHGELWILFIFITIWSSDSFAYFVGKFFGKRQIVPKVSPKKTLEGFIGGVIGGLAASLIYYRFVLYPENKVNLLIITLVSLSIIILGILGDLFESMLKRDCGVKDSGNLIPGHGGVLDRMDSLTFSLPVLYIYFVLGIL